MGEKKVQNGKMDMKIECPPPYPLIGKMVEQLVHIKDMTALISPGEPICTRSARIEKKPHLRGTRITNSKNSLELCFQRRVPHVCHPQ
jgi:hypothetical protein